MGLDRRPGLARGRLKPHRAETFKFSSDPELGARVTAIVGLNLDPPERAIVLSVDEKTQVQALDRTAPMPPMRPGQVERHTHDYKHNGTLSMLAALEIATGVVTGQTRSPPCRSRLPGLPEPPRPGLSGGGFHVKLDNVSTHKTPAVQRWLAHRKRFSFHFTPTSASGLNQVETWFSILTRQAIQRVGFESVRALAAAIERFSREWNAGASPFVWVDSADESSPRRSARLKPTPARETRPIASRSIGLSREQQDRGQRSRPVRQARYSSLSPLPPICLSKEAARSVFRDHTTLQGARWVQ